jgi:SAM-dependent methyltransferase
VGSLDDSSRIFHYHRTMIADHGADSSFALGWRNKHDQQVRFNALGDIADLNGRTVMDAGCGYADLYHYLKERYPLMAHYYGIEQITELIDKAILQYGELPDATFYARNFLHADLPVCDFVLASGSLNYGSSINGFVYSAIEKLYSHCSIGLGFNLLRYMPVDGTLVAYEPESILSFCKTLSPNVLLKTDYDEADFTIFIYR